MGQRDGRFVLLSENCLVSESHDEFRGEIRETECVNTCILGSQAHLVCIKYMCTDEHAFSEHIQAERYMHTNENGHLSIKQQSGIGAQR